MFRVEAGTIVLNTGSSIEKVHAKDLPCEKLIEWGDTIKDYERVQLEMKQYYEDVMKRSKRGRRE